MMRVAVWDTYVKRQDGLVMHFDILVDHKMKESERVFAFGRKYLESKTFETGVLTSKECEFCHVEQASEDVKRCIEEKGFYILEMENCD